MILSLVVLLIFGVWAVAPALIRMLEGRQPVPPLVIPAILCATEWQWWLQRQAEIAELRVEFGGAPYPPKGRGGASGPGWGNGIELVEVRDVPAGWEPPSASLSPPPARPSRPSPTTGVRYRSGDGRQDVWLPGPPNPGRAVRG